MDHSLGLAECSAGIDRKAQGSGNVPQAPGNVPHVPGTDGVRACCGEKGSYQGKSGGGTGEKDRRNNENKDRLAPREPSSGVKWPGSIPQGLGNSHQC